MFHVNPTTIEQFAIMAEHNLKSTSEREAYVTAVGPKSVKQTRKRAWRFNLNDWLLSLKKHIQTT